MDTDTQLAKEDNNSVNWGPVPAILLTLAIFFGSQLAGGLVIAIYPILQGWSEEQTAQWFNTSTIGQFLAMIVVAVVTVSLLRAYLKRKNRSFKILGLVKPRLGDLPATLAGVGAYVPLLIAAMLIVKSLVPSLNTEQEQTIGFEAANAPIELVMVFISLAVLPPLIEEIMMRGFLYGGLRSKLPIWVAALITSVIFALAHLEFGSGKPLLWIAAIDTFVLSLVLVGLREKTGSLWPCIGLHFTKNSLAFLLLFVF